jgi:hypothetical protein
LVGLWVIICVESTRRKETSEGQSEVSKVQKKSESADGGQELHPQLLKELPAATTAISIRKAEA